MNINENNIFGDKHKTLNIGQYLFICIYEQICRIFSRHLQLISNSKAACLWMIIKYHSNVLTDIKQYLIIIEVEARKYLFHILIVKRHNR